MHTDHIHNSTTRAWHCKLIIHDPLTSKNMRRRYALRPGGCNPERLSNLFLSPLSHLQGNTRQDAHHGKSDQHHRQHPRISDVAEELGRGRDVDHPQCEIADRGRLFGLKPAAVEMLGDQASQGNRNQPELREIKL